MVTEKKEIMRYDVVLLTSVALLITTASRKKDDNANISCSPGTLHTRQIMNAPATIKK
ncbi:MAG: hypothetical protein ABI416_09070 [Ginsengibacter sp.]